MIPAADKRHPRALHLPRQRRLAVAADRLADLAQRLTGDLLDVADLAAASSTRPGSSRPASSALIAITERL